MINLYHQFLSRNTCFKSRGAALREDAKGVSPLVALSQLRPLSYRFHWKPMQKTCSRYRSASEEEFLEQEANVNKSRAKGTTRDMRGRSRNGNGGEHHEQVKRNAYPNVIYLVCHHQLFLHAISSFFMIKGISIQYVSNSDSDSARYLISSRLPEVSTKKRENQSSELVKIEST